MPRERGGDSCHRNTYTEHMNEDMTPQKASALCPTLLGKEMPSPDLDGPQSTLQHPTLHINKSLFEAKILQQLLIERGWRLLRTEREFICSLCFELVFKLSFCR